MNRASKQLREVSHMSSYQRPRLHFVVDASAMVPVIARLRGQTPGDDHV